MHPSRRAMMNGPRINPAARRRKLYLPPVSTRPEPFAWADWLWLPFAIAAFALGGFALGHVLLSLA